MVGRQVQVRARGRLSAAALGLNQAARPARCSAPGPRAD